MIRFAAVSALALLSLAACERAGEPVAEPPSAAANPPSEAAMGPDADPQAVGGPDPASCDMFRPARAPEGLLVMVENGVLTRVQVSRNPQVETDRALNIGDTAAEVKRVYGDAAVVEPHKYLEAPAEYITVWATADRSGPNARGLRYEIGPDGGVTSIAGGGPSIRYVEGCS